MNPIIVPLLNGYRLTLAAHKTFVAQDIPTMLLYVDNASDDETPIWLTSLDCFAIRHQEPHSVAQSWNEGLSFFFGRGAEHCLVVNNDVLLRPDTYSRLLAHGGPFVTAVGNADPACLEYKPGVGCKDKVKIGRFLHDGIPLRGVVHVGTADGYELQWYLKLGLDVIGFEPFTANYKKCVEKYPKVTMHNVGIGAHVGKRNLHVTEGDAYGSTFLPSLTGETFAGEHEADVAPLSFFNIGPTYDCLVVDAQGMELEVLQSAGDKLRQFKCLNVECSRVPQYEGEASAEEVVAWLDGQGFRAITPIAEHDDILFVRKDVQTGERPHPDFSCFLIRREVWDKVGPFNDTYRGAYAEDADYHIRMHRAGIHAVCIDLPFYHVGAGTIKGMNEKGKRKMVESANANRARFKADYGVEVGTPEYYALFDSTSPDRSGQS